MKKQECPKDIPAAGKEFKPSHLSDKMIVLVIVICLILFSGQYFILLLPRDEL